MSEILDLREGTDEPDPNPVRVSTEDGLGAVRRQATVARAGRHVLIVPTEGTGMHMIDFEDYPVAVGSLLHVQPVQVHRFEPGDSFRAFIISIAASACPPGLFDPSCPNPLVDLTPSTATLVRAVVEDLALEQQSEYRNDHVMRAAAVYLLHHVARSTERPSAVRSSHDELLRLFRARVEQRFAQTRSVSEYANSIGTSTKTLARASTSLTGVAPKEIVDQRVVLEARRRLAESSASIASIGESLGFTEATNFTKFFVRMTGETPHEFRR